MERLLAMTVWAIVIATVVTSHHNATIAHPVQNVSTSHFSNDERYLPQTREPVEDRSDTCTNMRQMAQANRDAGYELSADIWQRAYRKEC